MSAVHVNHLTAQNASPAALSASAQLFSKRVKSKHSFIKINENININTIELIINRLIKTEFDDQFAITKSAVGNVDAVWVFKPKNLEYIFGFSIQKQGNVIRFKHALNTVSIWMLDFIRESLAESLGVTISVEDESKEIRPVPSRINSFLLWLRFNAESEERVEQFYLYQIARMPDFIRNLKNNSKINNMM